MSEEVSLEWHLDKLKKNLVMLSSPAKLQIALMDPHDIPLNLSVDMDCHYAEYRWKYIDGGLLLPEQVAALDRIVSYFHSICDFMEDEEFDAFWHQREQLFSNPHWENLRALAGECVGVLK